MLDFAGIFAQQSIAVVGGAELTVESVTSYTQTTNSTTHNITLPATNSGDLILILFANDGQIYAASAATFTNLGGEAAGGGAEAYVFAKIATGSEGGTTETITVTNSEAAGAVIYRISGWGGTIATDIAHRIGPNVISTTLNPDIASFTSGFGDVPTVWIAGLTISNTAAGVVSAPSGYGTLTSGGGTTSSNYAVVHTAHKIATAASEDSGAWTMEAEKAWLPIIVAVK